MHHYTVELRIEGRDLNPADVTANLGLEPTTTRSAGQRLTATKVYDKALWGYEVHPLTAENGYWKSLEEGLSALLAVFMPHRGTLAEYQRSFAVYIWVGHFSSSFSGGPTLSRTLLREMSEFGVELSLDTYFSTEPGYTPLHEAVERGQVDVVAFLLRHGASPDVKNEAGETAFDVAKQKGRDDIADLLAKRR
jgi:hypothetical protein